MKCGVCGWRSRTLLPIVRRFAKHLEHDYLVAFSSPMFDDNETRNVVDVVSLPQNIMPLVSLPQSHRGVQYVLKRGCTERDMWRWRMMWIDSSENRNRVLMPSFDSNGALNFWVARAIGDWKPKYVNSNVSANSIIFNEIDIDFKKTIVICEGAFDAIKCGDASVPLLGSALDETHILFDAIVKNNASVILMLDADALRKAVKIARLLTSYDISVKIARSQPDPGSMSHKACAEAIKNALEFNWQTMQKLKMEIATQ
jgi:hypothetical protein